MRKKISILAIGLIFLTLWSCSVKKSTVNADGTATDKLSERQRLQFDDYFFEANKAKLLGNYGKAVEYLLQCNSIEANNATVAFMLAEIYYQKRVLADAEKWAQISVNQDAKNKWFLKLLAKIQTDAYKFKQAAESYLKLCDLDPKEIDHYINWANVLIKDKKVEEAIKVFDLAEQRLGISDETTGNKEYLYMVTGQSDKAVIELKRLIKEFPNLSKYSLRLAEHYKREKNLAEAEKIYKDILSKQPEIGNAHMGLYEIYFANGRDKEAYYHLNEGLKDNKLAIDKKLELLISMIPEFSRDSVKGNVFLGWCKTVVETHPEESSAYAFYGDFLLNAGKLSEAREQYKKALEIDPADYKLWLQLCAVEESDANWNMLKELSEKGLELYPYQVMLYYYNSHAWYRLGDYVKSVRAANSGVSLARRDDEMLIGLYTILGDSYNELGHHKQSDANFDKVLEIDPNNRYVLNNYAYYLSLRGEKLELAKKMSEKTLELEPNEASFLDTYGWVLFQMGDYNGALKAIEKAVSLDGESFEVLEHLGDVYYKLGDIDSALKYWQLSKDKGSDSRILLQKIKERKIIE